MKIAIGSDHAGFRLKNQVMKYLDKKGIKYVDFGTHTSLPVDYPDIAYPVAKAVAKGEFDYGILICGTGVGASIVANKVAGIRAALVYSLKTAKQCREHGDCNIMALGGRLTDKKTAIKMVGTFLRTKFLGGRHLRRIRKITKIEKMQ